MVEVSYSEDRGTDTDSHFGYIYFKDNDTVRVGFSLDMPGDDEADIWPGNWGPVTTAHMKAAARHLRQEGLLPPQGLVKLRMNHSPENNGVELLDPEKLI